ncbi:hypothetical protein [Reichenbachiella versicolor]|uniref:hypothetical protein n=1 Tax=Reichenbachiella versicolor TaxID=1821036 RepID=UPI000D6DD213|nr:hypothetical protein [Reichenbachiella versicolor]
MVRFFGWVLLSTFIASCSAFYDKEKTNVNQIIKTQEIKKVSTTEILIFGEKLGLKYGNQVKELAVLFCNYDQAIDSISFSDLKIYYDTLASSFANKESKALFEAYQYSEENNILMSPSVQTLPDGNILYTFPIESNEGSFDENCEEKRPFGMLEIILARKLVVNSIEI